MATVTPDTDRIGCDRIAGKQMAMPSDYQRPVEKQGRERGKQDGHHHIAEEMPTGRDAQTGHEDDHTSGSASHHEPSAPLQPGPDEHAERQKETGDEGGFT